MKTISKIIALMLTLVLLLSYSVTVSAFDNPFVDVNEGDWYYDDVMTVAAAQVMMGTDATHFAPDARLTRGMMATILWRLDGSPQAGACDFTDVSENAYYYSSVAWAKSVGLVSGVGNNKFAPEANVTREQMATMVYNYAARRYSVRPYIPSPSLNLESYSDGRYVSRYAIEPMRWLVSVNGLHFSNNSLRPSQTATRAEVAATIALFLREDNGIDNYTGKSAYELAVENGYTGTVQEWLASLVGPPGKSAYEIAVEHGYNGSEEAWLASLAGKSAYEIALDHGFTGTEEQWLDSLHGRDGTSISDAHVDESLHLIISLSDGTTIDAGYVGVPTASDPGDVYTVTFVDYDGTILKTQRVEAGGNATPPADPVREGYTFSGWNGNYNNIQSDITITATYTQNDVPVVFYTVTFVDFDGSVLKSEQVSAGSNATPPTDPVREGYTFIGWSGNYTNVQSDVTITATYQQNSATYTVVFYDYDGTTVLATRSGIPEGGYAVPPTDPAKTNATFMGWSGSFANVTENTSARAVFSDEKNVLKVSSATGSIGDTVTVLITLDGAVKACAFDINIMYDPSLELISYDDDLDLSVVANTDVYENGILLNWSDTKDKTKQRDVIELSFQIKNTTKQALPIELTVNSIKEIVGSDVVESAYSTVTGIVLVN